MNTFDILNAWPNNRFMASGKIVSNSGRLVQVHNLPRNNMSDLDLARIFLKLIMIFRAALNSVPDVLSQLVRTAFIPSKGHRFIVLTLVPSRLG